MKIKDFKCKCGHNDFFFANKGNQKGIYCSYCGKWLKWADKYEQNLSMKPKSEWEQDHEILKAYSDGANEVLDKIRAEIENDWQLKKYPSSPFSCGLRRAIEIIDKYK